MNRLLIFLVILFIVEINVKADLIPEGKKRIYNTFEISNIDSFPDYTFIAFPVNISKGAPDTYALIMEQSKGIKPNLSFVRPQIYAIKKEDFDSVTFNSIKQIKENNERNAQFESFINNGNFVFLRQMYTESSTDKKVKYYYVQDIYGIEKNANDSLVLKFQKVIYKDEQNKVVSAKDSKMSKNDDALADSQKYLSYFIIIPVLALISMVTVILIRKMKA